MEPGFSSFSGYLTAILLLQIAALTSGRNIRVLHRDHIYKDYGRKSSWRKWAILPHAIHRFYSTWQCVTWDVLGDGLGTPMPATHAVDPDCCQAPGLGLVCPFFLPFTFLYFFLSVSLSFLPIVPSLFSMILCFFLPSPFFLFFSFPVSFLSFSLSSLPPSFLVSFLSCK